jgi:hypothetical protein
MMSGCTDGGLALFALAISRIQKNQNRHFGMRHLAQAPE